MKITIEPTCELHNAAINDTVVPVRTWRGRTTSGVEAYLFAVAPVSAADAGRLQQEYRFSVAGAGDQEDRLLAEETSAAARGFRDRLRGREALLTPMQATVLA